MRERTRTTAYLGIVCGYVAVILVTTAPWHWLKLVGALLLAAVPPGAAVMCWIDAGDTVAQAGMTLVVSLSLLALASATMIWIARWHPMAPLLILAGLGVGVCTLRLRSKRGDV